MSEQSSSKVRKAFDILMGIIGFIIGMIILFSFFREGFLRDYEKVRWDGSLPTIEECRYPFGSIFNKDKISFRNSELIIYEQSFLKNDVTTLPYSKVKEIIFTEGMHWKSFAVKREGFLGKKTTLYFKKNETKALIKDILNLIAPEIVIIEKQTLLGKIGINL